MFVSGASTRNTGNQPGPEQQSPLPQSDSPEAQDGHDPCDEIIEINVAGKKFQTYVSTLSRFPDSLLGDPERRDKFWNPVTKEYFFDRHRATFEAILYYYQSKGIMARPPNIPIHIFIKELIFFDVGPDLIENLQIEHGLKELKVEEQLPKFRPFKIMWQFLENPDSSFGAKIFAIASVVIIIISLIMFTIETLPAFATEHKMQVNGTEVVTPGKHAKWMFHVNTAIIVWFTVEFILRFISCPSHLKFFFDVSNMIDFMSILPYYLGIIMAKGGGGSLSMLRVVRVIRVLRVFKLSRHSRGLQILGNTLKASFNELMMLAFFLFVMILIFASCVYYAETDEPNTKFTSIPNSFWWAIVTMTTVGYGDMYPETLFGQLIGAMAVVCGVLTIALPVPVVVSNFEYFYTRERNRRKNEEAKKEQDKRSFEIATRERAKKNFALLRSRLGSLRKLSSRRPTSNLNLLDGMRPPLNNGDCHHDAESLVDNSLELELETPRTQREECESNV